MEESLGKGEEPAHYCAENEGENYLDYGVYEHRDDIYCAGVDRACNAEGDREDDKSHSVVKCNNGEKNVGYGTLRLILTNASASFCAALKIR